MPDYRARKPTRSPRQWQAYLEGQIQYGRPPSDLLAELGTAGLDAPEARALVEQAIHARHAQATKAVTWSAIMFAVGVLLTVGSASSPSVNASGQHYIVLWFGAIICGFVGIIYGLRLLSRVPRL
jgi:hypothetical protein